MRKSPAANAVATATHIEGRASGLSLAPDASAGKRKSAPANQAPPPAKKLANGSGMTANQKKIAKCAMAKQKKAHYVEQLPVWLVPPEGRIAISDAAAHMVLTTEYGKKYKDVLTYRYVLFS
jgi:hypothetical protein